MEEWIDVTKPLKQGMVSWPGQVAPDFKLISDMQNGHMANVTHMSVSVHTGTHMDAPLHFMAKGKDISAFPIEAGIGMVRVIEHTGEGQIELRHLLEYELRAGEILAQERIFFRTRHSLVDWTMENFDTGYIGLSADGARFLAEKNIQLVGIDYLSIAPYNALVDTHRILLSNNIWIVEGLDLRPITEGRYEMICLPLKIERSDGSPARVLLRKTDR